MKAQFESILNEFASGKRLLVAVSGGLDSMSLLHLLHSIEQPIEAAHCNFQLRDSESDSDQKLIEQTCSNLGIKLHTKAFSTERIANEKGQGIQEAARDLRYEWFESLLAKHNLDLITTAHHADDQSETIVMNFLRGSGPAGLSGMQILRSKRLRPLLQFKKESIAKYASEHNITHREDSSNSSLKYRRNRIRLEINPKLKEVNPNLVETLASQSRIMREVRNLLSEKLPEIANSFVQKNTLDIRQLHASSFPLLILGEVFRKENLSREQLIEILELSQTQSGSQFVSGHLKVIRNRETLIFSKNDASEIKTLQFNSFEELAASDFQAKMVTPDQVIFSGPHEAWLDADQISYPLILRKWHEGDRFQPLGMVGNQKISDLLVQKKVSRPDKDLVTVLSMGDEILWIPKLHSSEQGKLTEKTTRVLHLACKRFSF